MPTWPLTVPILPAPGAIPSTSYLAPGNGTAACNPAWLTEEDLLALLERVFPEWYLTPIKDPGPGYELYQAFAKALERVSLAVGRFECASFILFSHGGAHAEASVEFYRSSATAGGFTIKRGTICRTSSSNRSYVLLEDVVFGALDLFVDGEVRAVAPGYEYNVPGPFSTADGTILPGDIDTIAIPILDPVYAEPTIQCRQIADATGGQPAVLDQLGLDRDLPRIPNETDETYKERIRRLPDTVSIDAICRQLDAVFLPLGLAYALIETWENSYQGCWDQPLGDLSHGTMGTLREGVFAFDNPDASQFYGRWMDERDCPAGVIVTAPGLVPWDERGAAYDDTTFIDANDYETVLGRRATSAYDAPDQDSDVIKVPFYDGDDLYHKHFYQRLWNLLREIKGGGVHVAIELQGQ